MEQYEYHQRLVQENHVQMSCTMEFPPVTDVPALFQREKSRFRRPLDKETRRLLDYQINRIRDSQKAEVGFSLTSVQPRTPGAMTGNTPIQPKWSMTAGGSTNLIYPDVAKINKLVGKKDADLEHPASAYTTLIYQPVPQTQVYATGNFSNDQSHQVRYHSV